MESINSYLILLNIKINIYNMEVNMKKKIGLVAAGLLLSMAILAGCEGKTAATQGNQSDSADSSKATQSAEIKNPDDPIKLATMTDEEGRIVGVMIQQVLEYNGYKVDSKIGTFNNTTLVRQSLLQKQADLSIDYTGRGMMFIENVDITKYQNSLEDAFQTTKEADEKNGIIWMCYAPFSNTDGIAVRKQWSDENNIKTLEDFAKYVNEGKDMKLAIEGDNSYVVTAPTCLPGWEKAYGFHLNEDQILVGPSDVKTMLAEGTDGVNACHTYTSSGAIEALDLYILKDPKVVSPVYSPSPIATKELLEKYPEVEELIRPIFENLDEETAVHLNKMLTMDGISETKIAEDFLKEKGLIK